MNKNAKRTFSALATVAVAVVTVLGIVGLTAVHVSALEWNEASLSGPNFGSVGDTLAYTAQVNHCSGASRAVTPDRCDPLSDMTIVFQLSSTSSILAQRQLVTDSNGQASTSFTFTDDGNYKVYLTTEDKSAARVDEITISIVRPTIPPPGTTPTPMGGVPAAKGATSTPEAGIGNAHPVAGEGDVQQTGGASNQTSVTGDVTSTKSPSTSVAGDEKASAQSTPGAGIAVVLLAIIATALLMRRKG